MNKLYSSILISVMFLTACASLESNAYKTIGSVAVVVDNAMNGWGDYVRSGKATVGEQVKVKEAYVKYQKSMATAKVAVNTYLAVKDNKTLNDALAALDAEKNNIIDAIVKIKGL